MPNLLQTISNLLSDCFNSELPLPSNISNLKDKLGELSSLNADANGAGIDKWIKRFKEITGDDALRDTLLVRVLQVNFPRVAEFFTMLGIIRFIWEDDGIKLKDFSINRVYLNAYIKDPGNQFFELLLTKVQKTEDIKAIQVLILLLISSPKELVKLEHAGKGFSLLPLVGDSGISLDDLIDLVNSPVNLPLYFNFNTNTNPLEAFKDEVKNANNISKDYISILGLDPMDEDNKIKGIGIKINSSSAETTFNNSVNIGDGWTLSFGTQTKGKLELGFTINDKDLEIISNAKGDISLTISKSPTDTDALLIGDRNGTYFSMRRFLLSFNFRPEDPLFDISLDFKDIEFAVKPEFLNILSFGLNLPALLKFTSNLSIGYSQGKGLTVKTNGDNTNTPSLKFQFATPLNFNLGSENAGLKVDNIITEMEVSLNVSDFRFRTDFRFGAAGNFGPLKVTMDEAGVWMGRWTNGNGGLLPPKGIGLSIDSGPISGGGFLNIVNDREFAGALDIKILGIGAFAYGLYKTLPGGEVSFVALIGIRLPFPGVQIGFGFAISGFGGFIGVNRRADTDLIRERLATGSSGDVLFNDDPMKNAPKLLNDMRQFFPEEKGVFLIGPTLQINWLEILKLDVGFFMELPGPRKIFIAGSGRMVIGTEDLALIYIRMDFVGGIDTVKSLIFFDAVLVNSHFLGVFKISGGIVYRLAYGENGYFLFSVGGFHPSFNPGTMDIPQIPRAGVSYSAGPASLKFEMYLALTSNTFQLGGKIEAKIDISIIAAHGWFEINSLIQYKPFSFVADVDAGFDVEVKGFSFANVRVTGFLSGPGPLILKAHASVRVPVVGRVTKDATIRLNNLSPERIEIPNIGEELKKEINGNNVRSEGTHPNVILKPIPNGITLINPVGKIVWEQKVVPFDLDIQKFKGVELGQTYNLNCVCTTSDVTTEKEYDYFSMGTFKKEISEGEALNKPRFEALPSGLKIGNGVTKPEKEIPSILNVQLVILPEIEENPPIILGLFLSNGLAQISAERYSGAKMDVQTPRAKVVPESWNVHNKKGELLNDSQSPLNQTQAFDWAKHEKGIALSATEELIDISKI